MASPANAQKADRVAQQDTAQSQQIDEPRRFTWKIKNFSSFGTDRIYSDNFEVGGYKWRVLLFCKEGSLSMFLDVPNSATLPHEWSIDASFSLTVINQIHTKFSIGKGSKHQFCASERDWGFAHFMPLEELIHSRSGFLVNDAVIIEADVIESHLYTVIKETDINDASDTVPKKTDSQNILQVDVPETLGHFEAVVEPVSEPPVVPAAGPLATLLAKKARVYTTAALDSAASPVPAQSGAVHPCSTEVVSPTEPKLLLQQKDCVTQVFRILEAHMSEDMARIDDQAPEVTVGESLKSTLESFIGMHQAMQKYKIQLDSKSKKLEELQVANTSLTISKAKAEDALKAAEKKARDEKSKAAALEAELELLRTEKLIIEAKLSFALNGIEIARIATKAKEDELAQEKASRANEIEDVCQKARDKALEEFGKEVGGLVNQYHLACHIRSLTLAGLEPKDPRWYDVGFPIDGPTPPLKFPWE